VNYENFAKGLFDMRIKRGFTLIELLVVISIIAVLMAIMMPALRKAREQAVTVVCSSRLKDVGTMVRLYAQDYDDAIPATEGSAEELEEKPHSEWRWPVRLANYYSVEGGAGDTLNREKIFSYIIFGCPTQDKYRENLTDGVSGRTSNNLVNVPWRGTYGMNIFFSRTHGNDLYDDYRKFYQIQSPSSFPLYAGASAEYPSWYRYGGPQLATICWPYGPHPIAEEYNWEYKGDETKYNLFGPAPNHNGKTNYLMGDIHVEKMDIWPWKDFKGTDFHPRRVTVK
jgi:prepilin-type N-terminal cleavage/methylation domain-containing protein